MNEFRDSFAFFKDVTTKSFYLYVCLFVPPSTCESVRNACVFSETRVIWKLAYTFFFYKNMLNFLRPSRSYFFTIFRPKTFLKCSYFFCFRWLTMFLKNPQFLANYVIIYVEKNISFIPLLKIRTVTSILLLKLI